jgi:uncharacterized protein (TIGR02246 family)
MPVLAAGSLCLIIALTAGLSSLAQGAASPTKDDDAIRAVVREYVAARERRDPAAIGALFTNDADQLVSSGEWRRGREALVTGTLASSQRTGGSRSIVLESIRFPTRDVAIADGRYEITGGTGGDRRMWSTFVMTREGTAWRIAAIRNMLPAPPAQ